MKKLWKRILACGLVAVMIFQYLPDGLIASANNAENAAVPTIGSQVNLAQSAKNQLTAFNTAESTGLKEQFIDLGSVSVKGNTWYYSGVFSYDSFIASGTGGLNVIYGQGTYNGMTQNLAVTARPNISNGEVVDTQVVVWAGVYANALSVQGKNIKYATGQDYTFTVKVCDNKLSYWIDNTLFVDEFDLGNAGVQNITSKFGVNADGTVGTLKDIKIWDNVQTNLASDSEVVLPSQFNSDVQWINLGELVPKEGYEAEYTYFFSGTFSYTRIPNMGASGGLTFAVGDVSKTGQSNGVLTATARMYSDGTTNPTGTNYLVGTSGLGGYIYAHWTQDVKYAINTEYRWTVKVSSTGRMELWINDVNWTEKVTADVANYADAGNFASQGYTLVSPKFGLYADGTAGSVSNIQIWGEIEKHEAPTMGEEDVNLADGRTLPSAFTAGTSEVLNLGKLQTTTENATWYYSGTFSYESFTANGTGGLTLTFGEGVYNDNRTDLAVTARPNIQNGVVADTQIVVWAGVNNKALEVKGSAVKYATGRDYTFTVIVSDNKLSYWIDDVLFLTKFDLEGAGVTDIKPKFGFNPDGTSGTISDIKVWGDLERVNPAVKGQNIANLASDAGDIDEFVAGTNQYFNNEKINIDGNSWYYSGTFQYTSIPEWGGITFVFGTGTYDYTSSKSYETAVVGMRELSVTARAAGENVQKVLWADSMAVQADNVSGLTFETGKNYRWTIEVEDGIFTFWIDDTLIYDEIELASYGITNVKPKFGIKPDGSNGIISDIQVWDLSTLEAIPVFATKDTNEALFENINVTASTGRLQYEGITYGDSYAYSADINKTGSEGNIRLILGNSTNGTVEVYYEDGIAYMVEHTASGDVEVATNAIDVDVSSVCNYTVKNASGTISFWVNDVLVLNKVVVNDLNSAVGVAGESIGTVSNIMLWGDVTREVVEILYQKFEDISPYRGAVKTYPQAIGYVFGGWYTEANENSPVSTSTVSGGAYAKMVPEDVLSVMAQTSANTKYSSTAPTNLRFVTTVDSKRYSAVSFDVTFRGETRELEDVYVYTSIKVRDDEKEFSYAPTYFHEQSKYFYTYSVTGISKELFDTGFIVAPRWTTLDGTDVKGVERDIAVNDNDNNRMRTAQLGTGLGGSKLLQMGADKYLNQMMSYVIEAYNPSNPAEPYVIVMDGGEEKDAGYLYWLLTNRYDGHVDAWFFTHEHVDHYGALYSMLKNNQIGDGENQISIDNLYYNFPDNIIHTTEGQAIIDAVAGSTYLQSKVSEQVMGETYVYGTVKITILSDCDEYYGEIYPNNATGDQNNASIFMLVEFDDQDDTTENVKVLFLGDMGKGGEASALKQALDVANNLGIDLKGSVIQMAHHGNSGTSKAFYDMLDPVACLWPCTNWLWENMDRTDWIPGNGNWENVELYQFLMSQGCTEHYIAAYGNYELY